MNVIPLRPFFTEVTGGYRCGRTLLHMAEYILLVSLSQVGFKKTTIPADVYDLMLVS